MTKMTSNDSSNGIQIAIEDWNSSLATFLTPLTCLLVAFLIIGCLGNILVIIVYWCRKHIDEDRFYIPILSVADLLTCLVAAGGGIHANINPVLFVSNVGCKLVAFFSMLFVMLSSDILVVIAFDRYLKLCKPFHRGLSQQRRKLSLLVLITVGICMAIPCLFYYGSVPQKHSTFNVTGWRCINTQSGSDSEIAYKIVAFVYTIVRLCALVVFYYLIGRSVFKRINKKKRLYGDHSTERHSDISSIHNKLASSVQDVHLSVRVIPEECQSLKSNHEIRLREEQWRGVRLSLIFMLITVIYLISTVPKVALMITESIDRKFWTTLSPSGLLGFRFLYTFFIFNNVCNPFIYGFLDAYFRKKVYKTVKCSLK